ncbi:hypothetical protein BC830DRAFT_1140352 [Chytriomyces sp. MP71]|nr:hypothetical protein BC830DRAFT_1140352 [Chytriomyces sp. MP71]
MASEDEFKPPTDPNPTVTSFSTRAPRRRPPDDAFAERNRQFQRAHQQRKKQYLADLETQAAHLRVQLAASAAEAAEAAEAETGGSASAGSPTSSLTAPARPASVGSTSAAPSVRSLSPLLNVGDPGSSAPRIRPYNRKAPKRTEKLSSENKTVRNRLAQQASRARQANRIKELEDEVTALRASLSSSAGSGSNPLPLAGAAEKDIPFPNASDNFSSGDRQSNEVHGSHLPQVHNVMNSATQKRTTQTESSHSYYVHGYQTSHQPSLASAHAPPYFAVYLPAPAPPPLPPPPPPHNYPHQLIYLPPPFPHLPYQQPPGTPHYRLPPLQMQPIYPAPPAQLFRQPNLAPWDQHTQDDNGARQMNPPGSHPYSDRM